ncbi:MAG: GTPase Era [Chitinophagaceae bacterium]|nr:GTPase Era [Chitinophagaceae bacterium]MCB9046222.1 GTPase Era [Chitinophagales bacterium]
MSGALNDHFKAGFVNIFGAPNAGKSTLLNALLGEQLVITSPKVQTTRHRILGILNDEKYQVVFSDTPGIIIEPKYKLHQKMMLQLKSALEDADVAILMHDITEPVENFEAIVSTLNLKVPVILLLNKTDLLKDKDDVKKHVKIFSDKYPDWKIQPVSAVTKANISKILPLVLSHLPEGFPFYPDDNMSDRPMRFFASELIRQQIYELYHEEIPYHTAVIIDTYEEKTNLTVIKATIIVSRETQKVIVIGKKGSQIKQLGINSRKAIEEFIQRKVHLELFVKVRPKWRDNENYLKEYGYNS